MPTGKNPAVKVPLGEIKTLFAFSTDKDEPLLRVSEAEDRNGEDRIKGRASTKNGIAMDFVKAQAISVAISSKTMITLVIYTRD